MDELERIYRKISSISRGRTLISTLELSRETGIPEERIKLALVALRDAGKLKIEEVNCATSCESCPLRKVCTLRAPGAGEVLIVSLEKPP
jgi:hypothetical protein